MRLVRLVYASTFAEGGTTREVQDIVARAAARNRDRHLTGLLFFGSGKFLQVLEGGSTAVNKLYAALQQDARHRELHLISYQAIEQREFEGWGMAHATLDQVLGSRVGRETVLRYTTGYLDPYTLSPVAALSFLREVRDHVVNAERLATA